MSKTRELQYWQRKLDRANDALNVARDKFYERIAMFAHENEPSGRSAKRWYDSWKWKQMLYRDIALAQHTLEHWLEGKPYEPRFATPVIANEFYKRNG